MMYRGIVQKGTRRGESLGFPTANISLTDESVSGIYAARVWLEGHEYHAAVYADQRRKLLEAHLGKFKGGDLYGKEIKVELLKKIREDKRFDDENTLREAIAQDIQDVRDFFQLWTDSSKQS